MPLERIASRFDLYLKCRFAPYEWLDMLGVDQLIEGQRGEVRHATGELASDGADFSIEVTHLNREGPLS